MFDNGSEFKQYFTPLLKYFDIKPVLMTIKNPQANSPLEGDNQVILHMIVTKDLAKKVFDYIDPLGETLKYMEWAIMASYHRTFKATPGQYIFGRDMISNLTSVIDWQFITNRKHQQLDIDTFQ